MSSIHRAQPAIRYVSSASKFRWCRKVVRKYHSDGLEQSRAQTNTESDILNAAIKLVPEHGFSVQALRLGAQQTGYPTISASYFADGPFALVKHHLVAERLALSKRFQRPELPAEDYRAPKDVIERVRAITLSRLLANEPLITQYQSALALLVLPSNLPSGLKELARLADEILFLAGATAVTTAWYTDRMGLASIYASSELYMTQDNSQDFSDTKQFVTRRMDEADTLRAGTSMVGQWLGMQLGGAVNGLRSKGIRI